MEIQQTTESYELFTLEPIPDTPFNIVTRKEEQDHAIVMGEHRITEWTQDINQLYEKINSRNWELILNAVVPLLRTYHKLNTNANNDSK